MSGFSPNMNPVSAPTQKAMMGSPWRKAASLSLSFLGMTVISYMLGACVMFYHLPTSRYLADAFAGASAWHASRSDDGVPSGPSVRAAPASDVDRPEKTFDGFTLYTYASYTDQEPGKQAFLVNMRREVVHRWSIRLEDIWPKPPHVDTSLRYPQSNFFGSYLYPNGDLLVTFHSGTYQPPGVGLAKIDAESKLLWAYPAAIHHDVDVAEDGTIYALRQDFLYESRPGIRLPIPALVDYVVTLSPDGKPLREPISLLEAFRDSPYAAFLAPIERPRAEHLPPFGSTAPQVRYFDGADVLHTNCVRVLRRDLAAKFPQFKAGQVMLSMRTLNVLAMLDPEAGRIVWAARGPWLAQHDPQFLPNGHLLIFDNLGAPSGSRVLEFDPKTQSVPWSYTSIDAGGFYSSERGMSQRLPNGNTFIVNTEGGKLFEITRQKEVVWSCSLDGYITSGRRYPAAELPFLGQGQRARP